MIRILCLPRKRGRFTGRSDFFPVPARASMVPYGIPVLLLCLFFLPGAATAAVTMETGDSPPLILGDPGAGERNILGPGEMRIQTPAPPPDPYGDIPSQVIIVPELSPRHNHHPSFPRHGAEPAPGPHPFASGGARR